MSNSYWMKNFYFRYIFGKAQWLDWAVIFACVAAGCLLLVTSYPCPEATSDSYNYLRAAMENQFNAYRPFGYSYFLRVVHVFSHSLYSILVAQGLLYALSLGFLLLAVKKYWPPRKPGWFLLFEALVALSPAALFLLNYILSDSVFCSLFFIMIAMVIVMIKEGSWVAMVLYALAFFAALHTRYLAVHFPLALIPVFLFMPRKWYYRVAAILVTCAVLCVLHEQICRNMKSITGVRSFATGFGGWQLTNNALHVLPHLSEKDLELQPDKKSLQTLHGFFLYTRPYIKERTGDGKTVTTAFMWDSQGPMKHVLNQYMQFTDEDYYHSWIAMGNGDFRSYGIWLTHRQFGKYIRYFIFPNSKSAFLPKDIEVLGGYEAVKEEQLEVRYWFDAPVKPAQKARKNWLYRTVSRFLPWIELGTWIIFLASALFLLFGGKRRSSLSRETCTVLWFLFLLGLFYYGTVTYSSPIVLRYWLPFHAIKLCFAWIVLWHGDFFIPLSNEATSDREGS